MTISVTDLGTAFDDSGASTVSITIPAGGVPAGSLIVVVVQDASQQTSGGACADTASNTYASAIAGNPNNITSDGLSQVFYSFNVAALSSGNTIAYTKGFHVFDACISAFYATGVDTSSPLDSAVTASNFGFSGSPTLVSGTPSMAGELFVGTVCCNIPSGGSYTQDTANGWASPPDTVLDTSPQVLAAGGTLINSGTGTKTFAPTIGGAAFSQFILGFKPAAGSGGGPRTRMMMGVGC